MIFVVPTNEQMRITNMRRYRIPTINFDAIGRNFFDSVAIFIEVKAEVLNDHNMLMIRNAKVADLFDKFFCSEFSSSSMSLLLKMDWSPLSIGILWIVADVWNKSHF